jgi:hypothetical protein
LAVPGVSPAVRQPAVRQLLVHYPTHLRRGARAWGRKVLIATFTLIGGGVEPRQNLAANAFSRRRSPLAILFSARYGFSPGLLPKCRQAFADPSSEKSKKWAPHYAGESRTARNRPIFPRQMLRWPYNSWDLQAPLEQRHTIHLREHRQPDSVSSGIGSKYRTISNSPLSSAPR